VVGACIVAAGVVLLLFSTTALPANGQEPDAVGWWYRLKSHALPVAPPAPPNVPAGGLYVEQDPDGPGAVSAVRARVAGSIGATLTLTAAQGSTTTLGAPVQACTATSAWEPALPAPGYWEDAPTHGTTCAPGTVSTDGKYVAFHFSGAFLSTEVLDVVIAPEDGAPPFAIAFDPPGSDSLTVETAPAELAAPPVTSSSTFTPEPSSGAPLASPPFTVAAPTSPSPATTVASPVAAPPAVVVPVASLVSGDPDHAERAAALAGASCILVGWWLLSGRRARAPQRVAIRDEPAVVAHVRTGGIGRFARPRERAVSAIR
jgi:hypothetical protein